MDCHLGTIRRPTLVYPAFLSDLITWIAPGSEVRWDRDAATTPQIDRPDISRRLPGSSRAAGSHSPFGVAAIELQIEGVFDDAPALLIGGVHFEIAAGSDDKTLNEPYPGAVLNQRDALFGDYSHVHGHKRLRAAQQGQTQTSRALGRGFHLIRVSADELGSGMRRQPLVDSRLQPR